MIPRRTSRQVKTATCHTLILYLLTLYFDQLVLSHRVSRNGLQFRSCRMGNLFRDAAMHRNRSERRSLLKGLPSILAPGEGCSLLRQCTVASSQSRSETYLSWARRLDFNTLSEPRYFPHSRSFEPMTRNKVSRTSAEHSAAGSCEVWGVFPWAPGDHYRCYPDTIRLAGEALNTR